MHAAAPLVVKIGGAGVDDPRSTPQLWQALAEAHRILRGQLVVVHGGGRAVDRHLERLGMPSERREGIRITPPEQIEQVAAVLAGLVNKLVVGAVQKHGLRAAGLCLGDGAAIRTARADELNFDAGRVGVVIGGDGALLRVLLLEGFLPVMCSIGLDDSGELLNVNADDAAAGIARILHARALVLLTDTAGILDEAGQVIPSLHAADVRTLIERGTIHGGMIPKARAAAAAAQSAGAPAIIAGFKSPADLVRLARGEPVGTQILPTRHDHAPPHAAPLKGATSNR
jgi:acetylglutamate kinase